MAALVLSCGRPDGDPTDPLDPGTGPWAFRASLIDPALILSITPLGSLNPPSPALPTDHIYIRFANTNESPAARRTAFFAPAEQRLGTTGSSFEVDLSVVNEDITLPGIVNPARYPQAAHIEAPLKYFDEPLRSQLYAKVERLGPELDGKIDYDIPGRLSGNWFTSDSIPLVFAYHWYDPARVVISVSGGLLRNGVYGIAGADPLPRDVSVASGLVRYTLSGASAQVVTGVPTARMLVQMLDDQRIRVEMFDLSANAAAFTDNARVFVR